MPTWPDRVWHEYRAGNLTRAYRDVLLTLRTYRGRGGLICPSHETLADRARCSVSTALRALQHARSLGLVSWAERRVRVGWRWLRTSNVYSILTPAGPVSPGMRPVWWRRRTNCQSDGGAESKQKEVGQGGHKAALAHMVAEASGMPDLLARRRAAIEGRLLTKVVVARA